MIDLTDGRGWLMQTFRISVVHSVTSSKRLSDISSLQGKYDNHFGVVGNKVLLELPRGGSLGKSIVNE